MSDRAGSASRPARGIRLWAGVILVPVALIILLSLGTWQVSRLQWKETLLTAIEERSTAPAASVADISRLMQQGTDIDYRHATASGHFLHQGERHFLATFNGESGFYIYTPLQLDDGSILIVNRGFVPYDRKAASTRPESLVAGPQVITGLARAKLAQKPSSMVPDNDEAANIFYWKDLDRMAASVGLPKERVLPFFLDADDTANPGGLPKGGVTQIDLPNNHLQYAVTWYGLAVALIAVVIAGFFRRKAE